MPNPSRLPAGDVLLAMRAVGDCRDVGRDPSAWNLRIACFFLDSLRSVFTSCFTHQMENGQPTGQEQLCAFFADNRAHKRWLKFIENHRYRLFPTVLRFTEMHRGRPFTATRRDMIPDREWRDGEERQMRRSIKQDEILLSIQPFENGLSHIISLNRADGDGPFTPRERNLVRLIHDELGQLFGRQLSLKLQTQALPPDLSPRLQAVLICLLSGDSDKEIAARIGLSVHTVHEYVTSLFRRFDSHSRAELFALASRNNWMPAALPPK